MNKLNFSIENKGGTAEIRLIGYIGGWEANSEKFMNKIDELINAGVKDLNMYINSYGGSVLEANEIINQLRRFKGNKTAQVGAIAASAASYLLPYFHKVKAFKNSQAMLHDPIMRLEVKSEADFESSKELYTNSRNTIIDAYEKKINLERKDIEDLMAKTTWLSASKGKEIGLFDEIIEDDDNLPNNTSDLMNIYNQLPSSLINSIPAKKDIKQKSDIKMKEVLKALGLPEDTTEEKAVEAITALKTKGVIALTALAESKGLKKESIEKLANSDFDATLEMVTESKSDGTNISDANIADKIAEALKGGKSDVRKTIDDYSPDELEALFESDPKEYEKLLNS